MPTTGARANMTNKFEQLLELLVNEENDKAQELFHEIVVEKSRDIYEGLIDSDTAVDEAKEKSTDEDKVDEAKEESTDEEANEAVEIEEESIEEIGGDATDDLITDISADEKGDAETGDVDAEAGDEAEGTEERVADLEDALDELKAEFEKMMNGDAEEEGDEEADAEEALDPMQPAQDAQAQISAGHAIESKAVVKEYKIQKSADNGDKADNKKSPVNSSVKSAGGTTSNIVKGGEDSGRPAPTAAKIIGDVANTGGKATVSLKAAPKAETSDKADNKKSPVASK